MLCKEHDFSSVARIDAYELGTLQFDSPVFVMSPVVGSGFIPDGAMKMSVRFTPGSQKCNEKTNTSVAGYVHELSVDWETQTREASDYDDLIKLQNIPHELVITYFGGSRKVIRTDRTSYQFLFNDDNGKVKCSATLVNGQGLTLVE